MSRWVKELLFILNTIAAVVICFVFALAGNRPGMIVTVIIYISIALVLSYSLRCKHCGRWPRKYSVLDEYCPGCGKPLD